jgi:hypothetical protein
MRIALPPNIAESIGCSQMIGLSDSRRDTNLQNAGRATAGVSPWPAEPVRFKRRIGSLKGRQIHKSEILLKGW